MNFKQQLVSDIEVFFNEQEFSEYAFINGVKAEVVITDLDEETLKGVQKNLDNYGLAKSYLKVYFKRDDFENNYFISEYINLNEKDYFVESISYKQNVGVLILSCVGSR